MKINTSVNRRKSASSLGKCVVLTFTTLIVFGLSGCSYAPTFNLLGSYFPAWIICFAVATGLTTAIHATFTKTEIVTELWRLPVVYTCLIIFLSCTLWIIFFN